MRLYTINFYKLFRDVFSESTFWWNKKDTKIDHKKGSWILSCFYVDLPASFFSGVGAWLVTVLGQFPIIYFRGLGLGLAGVEINAHPLARGEWKSRGMSRIFAEVVRQASGNFNVFCQVYMPTNGLNYWNLTRIPSTIINTRKLFIILELARIKRSGGSSVAACQTGTSMYNNLRPPLDTMHWSTMDGNG